MTKAESGPGWYEPLRNVLVPTDFSQGADRALARALLLPFASRATIHLVHVLAADVPAKARKSVAAIAKRSLAESIARVSGEATARSIKLTSEVLMGEPFVEVIRHSRSLGAELIVLGRHGQRRIRDRLIGTTAERIVRKGAVPAIVVNRKPTRPYRKPLIATDLGDVFHRTIKVALRVLGPDLGDIRVAHAFNVPYEGFVTPISSARETSNYRRTFRQNASTRLTTLLADYKDLGVHWKITLRPGDPRAVILSEAATCRADLIAIATHGRSGVAHALLGSVAEWVLTAADCDVLVVRPIDFSFKLP